MELNKKDFIRGNKKPVQTSFGLVRFLTFGESMDLEDEIGFISQNTLHFYYLLRKNIPAKDKKALKEFESFKKTPLLDIVLGFPDVGDAYVRVFEKVLDINDYDEVALTTIITSIFSSSEAFDEMRRIVMEMNLLKEEKVSPNEELQHWFDIDKQERRKKSKDSPENSDILTSLVAKTSHSFADIEDMTLFQVYSLFERVDTIVAYETTTMYATAGADVKVESWAKKIDMFATKDKSAMSFDEFKGLDKQLFS